MIVSYDLKRKKTCEDHNPINEARHYQKAQQKYDLSTRQLAEKYGESHQYYKLKLELLELPETVNLSLQNGQITETHCRHICKLLNQECLVKRFETLYNQPQNEAFEFRHLTRWKET